MRGPDAWAQASEESAVSEEWTLHTDRRRAGSFGDDPEAYDRVRPAYPAALIDVLMAEQPHTVLDVGCGTGIVARLFTARGCEVLGLEPDRAWQAWPGAKAWWSKQARSRSGTQLTGASTW